MGARLVRWLIGTFAVAFLASCSDDASTLGTRAPSSNTSGGDGTSGSDGATGADGTSGGTTDGTDSGSGSAAEICVATINQYRKTKGLPPYARWTDAEVCADGEAKSDASTGRAHGAFGGCKELGQNECPGWAGPAETMIPQCLKAMWGEGPGGGHYEAMASKQYTKVACGFGTAKNGAIWSVQNFR